ncbi:hypothetical protein LQ564_00160 [Massilia sp. G4R7]|uniref:Uncharacterized protein n=1 Tax=Massilia phyllostachyos TaxID=2898585 RepID=A0ABS8PYY9_9BURK|nr:hypothetical protein [Massilia phyllostachyos]MCD2514722.1 hypothetical protein [Massilia phyllostachyos]
MTPEEIRTCLAAERSQLHASALQARDGYSFWFGVPANNNRIIRVSRASTSSHTKLKLAVTDRLPDLKNMQQIEFIFDGNTDDLLRYVDREIELYESRIAAP